MALVVRRTSPTKVRVITTLIALFALVAQPIYGLVASHVANAAPVVDHVVLNEIMANPVQGEREWVELYNPLATPVDMSGWRINDGSNNFTGVFSAGTSIAAHGYLVREATNSSSVLNDTTRTLSLQSDAAGSKVDQVTYAGIAEGTSYARSYDASSDWVAQASPTKGLTNGAAPATAANTICDAGCQYTNIADAVAGAAPDTTLTLKQDQTVGATVTITKPLTIDGQSAYTIYVSGMANALLIKAKATISNVKVVKTDSAAQNIFSLQALNVTIKNVDFKGNYATSADPTTRGLEISGNDFIVSNSSFTNLRQPAYINGFTGTISNSAVSGTRGWVVTGNSNVMFTGNTWNGNSTDIAIIDDDGNPNTPAVNNYPCSVVNAIKQNNANANVDNQLLARPCAPLPAASITELVTNKDMNGWSELNDNAQGGTATFETGPATAPKGNGSVELKAANEASDFALATGDWNGTKLADIAALNYASYKKGGNSGPVALALNFDTDVTDSNNAWQGRLTYEPTYANPTTVGQWQTFDHMMTDRAWWFSSGGVKAQLNCDDTIANLCTLDQIVAKFPKSGIHNTLGAVLLRVDGSWTDFTGNVDALTIATGTKNITYDFEPADTTAPTVPANGAPNGKFLPTNEFDFTWDASTDVSSPVTYEFQSSLNSAQTNGVLTTGVWSSGTLSEPKIHSSGAPDGTWYWQVRAIDAAGNKSNWSQVWKVTLDTQKPVVAISSPTNNQPLNVRSSAGKLSISGTASDSSNFNYYYCYVTITGHGEVGKRDAKCDTAWALGTPSKTAFAATAQGTTDGVLGSVDLTGASNGNYTVHLVAYDKAGNKSETSMPFVLDNTRPTIQVNPLSNRYNPATYSVSATEADTALNQVTAHVYNEANTALVKSCSTNVRAQNTKEYTLTCDTTGLADGTYTIRANATDTAGNLSVTDSSTKFTLDHQAPSATATFSNNNGNAVTADDVTVTLKATEAIQAPAGWDKVDDATYTKAYGENGKYSVVIEDLAGNTATVKYEVKRIDRTAPVITLSGPQTNGIYTGDVTYVIAEQSVRDITIDGVTYNEKTAPKVVSAEGDHVIVVTDKAGNSAAANFTIDSKAPVLTVGEPVTNEDGTFSVKGTTTDRTAPITVTLNGNPTTRTPAVGPVANDDGTWTWSANLGTLTAKTMYTIVVNSLDGAGNKATAAQTIYTTPAVQGGAINSVAPLTIRSPQGFGPVNNGIFGNSSVFAASTPAIAVQAPADESAVLGTKTASEPTSNDTVAAIASSTQGWKIFGVAWYWWLLLIAAVATIWYWIAAARRRSENA